MELKNSKNKGIIQCKQYHLKGETNYYKIDPDYGTEKDFQNFLGKTHKMGFKVILDMMMNHTPSQHPWFIEASTNKNSKYRNYYIWADSKTNINQLSAFGPRQWYKKGDSYYYALSKN
ncbi:alpha-amylase family glycosyl hydrolase [Caldicellulosiruptor changbaiensis]|uniref:alpha-amylase family glycosyl hydrolase n=1 Tax=Caldicellulosiruptor changbaiensis TaxID=1222016 RepID=UPI001F497B7E|nr:alpha-amylase family glycosyl hydrolase [Caldicellulosiruptor changbaiensis]